MLRDMRVWQQELLHSRERAAIPIMTQPGLEFIGEKTGVAVRDGEVHARSVQALALRYPAAAATMMMDLSVESEAFGAAVQFSDTEVPTVSGRLVSDHNEVEGLAIPALDCGRLPQYLRAAHLAAETITDRPVLAGCIGPFSLAGRLFDLSEIMTAMLLEPDTVQLLLGKCAGFLAEYILGFKRAGANGVIMAEPAAGMLSPDLCHRFSSLHIRGVVERVSDDHFLFILHNCGHTDPLVESMLATGADGLHFGNRNTLLRSLELVPRDKLVLGNLDPVRVLKLAAADEVYQQTSALLQQTAAYPQHVLSSGCDTPPGVPLANMDAFWRALHDFNLGRR